MKRPKNNSQLYTKVAVFGQKNTHEAPALIPSIVFVWSQLDGGKVEQKNIYLR